jgi:hypothetical protein
LIGVEGNAFSAQSKTTPTASQFMQTILNSVFWKGACSNFDTFTLVICFPESKAVKRSMIAWRLHSGGPGRLGELSGEMTIALFIFLATNPAS